MRPEWPVLQSRVVPQDLGKRLGNRRRRSNKTPDKPNNKKIYSLKGICHLITSSCPARKWPHVKLVSRQRCSIVVAADRKGKPAR